MNNSAKTGFRIGRWDVDPQQNLLKSPEHTKTLEPKVMDVLVFLAERQGEVVSRQQILDAVWREVVVGDEVVSRAVSLLRTELGDDQKNPRYLKTISKRGYCLIANVILTSSNESITRRTLRKPFFAIVAVLALALAFFAIDREEPERSVAVLPFEDMSPNGDQKYLGDGVAVELLNELTRLDCLRVAPSLSTVIVANESRSAIGEKLNVETIVEGNIRKDRDQVRITAQLINIADEKILWSDTYDRKLENIFAIQEDIATNVSGALGVTLGGCGVNTFRGAGTRNIEAYELYLQNPGTFKSDEGIRHLSRAIELDPNYAAAMSSLAFGLLLKRMFKYPGENRENDERAYALALRAVELEPESAHSNALLGIMLQVRYDWIGAEEAHLKALSLLSDRPILSQYGGFLSRTGHSAVALEQYEKAEALEPLAGLQANRFPIAMAQGRFADARDAWARNPKYLPNSGGDLIVALHEGDSEEIKAIMAAKKPTEIATIELYSPVLKVFDSREMVLSTLRAVYADNGSRWPSKLTDIALLAAYFGDEELALQTIGEEARIGSPRFHAAWYPLMADVRQSQGFKELVTELNLVEYWRASGWPDRCRPLSADDFTCW
jgi:TolB-like protein/DNA-binding winged helix-turn-helix (wHTH) protein